MVRTFIKWLKVRKDLSSLTIRAQWKVARFCAEFERMYPEWTVSGVYLPPDLTDELEATGEDPTHPPARVH